MKISERWLREWVNPAISSAQLVEHLTMAGLEVDAATPMGFWLEKVLVGKVLSIVPHPDADRLRVCTVLIHEENPPLTIVCGAPNVREGLKVAVATVGAVLPGNFAIKRAKIRGIESSGMLCSESELGIGEPGGGIMELPEEAQVGRALSDLMQFPDQVIDISVSPNRGDCLSALGIAREIAAVTKTALQPLAIDELAATHAETLPIQVLAPQDCPRYLGRILRGINPQAVTPFWLKERLRRSGIRSIHPVVDAANYVMLELGQPMHAFDLATLTEHIQVRRSHPGEQVTLLDGQTLSLQHPALVIADASQILAIAGVMGGESSAVSAHTTDLFLESAFFSPAAVRSSLRQYPLQSDSAHRYERGVDPQLPQQAMSRLTSLLLEIVGGSPGPVVEVAAQEYLPKPPTLLLRFERIKRVLGTAPEQSRVKEILLSLGMQVSSHPEGWLVVPPSFRFDMTIEADLIEEVARVYGYNQIPDGAITAALTMLAVPENRLTPSRIRHYWIDHGYTEVINYSFISPKLSSQLDPEHTPLALENPMSSDMAVMRTSLWPGLIQTASFNLNRQQSRLRLFELGTCFIQVGPQWQEQLKLAGLAIGSTQPEQWGVQGRLVDFFDIKGDLTGLIRLTGAQDHFKFVADSAVPSLHPGCTARIQRAGKWVGHVGQLHPLLQQQLDFPDPVFLFELFLSEITAAELPRYVSPSKYPSIRRDLAFTVDEQVSYQAIYAAIQSSVAEVLREVKLFDVYQGEKIPPGKKSMAIGLTFQASSRTLTDQEVDEMMLSIISGLKQDFAAILRDY